MKYFSAFSGIGGAELGLPKDWECVGFSEIKPEAIEIYQKHFPEHKNYGDITKIQAENLPDFDFLVGGFPCQSFSVSGSRKGFDDARGTLFFDLARIIKEKRPRSILLENVNGLLSHDKGRTYKIILSTLAELGYDTEALVFDSYFFGAAPRKRVYMFANDREQEPNDWQRNVKAKSLYSRFRERIGNQDEERQQESVRNAERTLREFAKLPTWLDSWDTFYTPQISPGKCDNTVSS